MNGVNWAIHRTRRVGWLFKALIVIAVSSAVLEGRELPEPTLNSIEGTWLYFASSGEVCRLDVRPDGRGAYQCSNGQRHYRQDLVRTDLDGHTVTFYLNPSNDTIVGEMTDLVFYPENRRECEVYVRADRVLGNLDGVGIETLEFRGDQSDPQRR